MKKILLPLGLLLANINTVKAQQQSSDNDTNIANIIPPSPTAYALGNYGNVPVGLFTGTANVNIPLFNYKTNNISLPIAMFYGNNGIKIDEISSNVGLGWNLNSGGVISRTVRDGPDDTSQTLQLASNAFAPGNTPAFKEAIYNLGNISGGIDTEADIYSFNFNGVSGKFFYDRNNQVHLIDQQALKIEKNTNGFIITLSNGEKYYFTETELTIFKTLGTGHQLPNGGITAWYLTKIVHPKGDEVYFTYEDMYLDYTASQSQDLTQSQPYTNCTGAYVSTITTQIGVVKNHMMTVHGKRIKTISSNNLLNGSIDFSYSTDATNIDTDGNYKIQNITQTDKNGTVIESATFNYLNTVNKRNFLTGIVFKDPKKSYAFNYDNPSQFPARLSYSRDFWGYYNGKINTILVPKIPDYNLEQYNPSGANQKPDPNYSKLGMLTKITYPTKGYTELEYEGNTYWGTKTVYPPYSYKHMEAVNGSVGIVTQQYNFMSPINQTVQISGESGFNISCVDSGQTHTPIGRIQVFDPANNSIMYSQFINNQINTVSFNATAGVNYTVKLSASRCTYIYTDAKYYPSAPQVFDTNLDTGGVRIKRTKDYDNPSANPVYTRYYYGKKDDINHSSGDKGTDPVFVYNYLSSEDCSNIIGQGQCLFNNRLFLVQSSNSLLPLFDTDKSTSTFYKYVTISHGGDNFERGGQTKQFNINRDSMGGHLWGLNDIQSTPYTNYGWNNGVEVLSEILRKDDNGSLVTIQQKESSFVKNDASTFEMKNYTHRRNDLMVCTSPTPYNCTQYDIGNPDHACYGKNVGFVINTPYIDNLDVNEYRTISYWSYLSSEKTTDYLDGTPVQTQTEYFYDNPSNYQLSRQKTISPDGTINEVSYQYAHEKGNQLMIGKNMVGIPLQTTTTQTIGSNTKTLSKKETIYPASVPTVQTGNLVLPLEVKSYDTLNNIPSTEVKYDKYDEKGNILQYTTKDGLPVAIVWGYNKTQPIAKVEGITYDQLTAAVSISAIVSASDQDASNPATEDQLLSVLNDFRKQTALSDKQVTTFTYDPLIGVTSITPPTGIREIYIYDTANRLKEVKVREKDNTGNYVYRKVKEFNYNYKQ